MMVTEEQFDPSPAQVRSLVAYMDAFVGPPETLFRWRGGDRNADGVITMPWIEYSRPVMAFIKDAYQLGFVIEFNWPDWQATAEALQLSPEAMSSASLSDLAKLLTVHLRKDRFVEGHLASAFRHGWIQDILWNMNDRAKSGPDR